MKIGRKALSLLLCLCMLLSVMGAGLTAFAAEKTAAVTALEEKINAYTGNMDTATPTEEDLAGFNEMVADYQKLDQAQVDSIDIFALDQLYKQAVNYAYRTSTASGTGNKRKEAGAKVLEQLSPNPTYWAEAKALYPVLNDSKKTGEEKLEAFGKASANARIYAGLYYASYDYFYNKVEKDAAKGLEMVVKTLQEELLKAKPNTDPKPSKPTKPNVKNYPLGEEDPQYIADYNAYMEGSKIFYTWDANDRIYKGGLYLEAIAQVCAVAPEYQSLLNAATLLYNAKLGYDKEEEGAVEKAATAVEAYNAFSRLEKVWAEGLSYTFYAVPSYTSFWSITSYRLDKLYSSCVDIGNAKYVDAFIDVINGLEEPYTRADIDAARAAYANVPSSLAGTLPEAITAKYKIILACIGPDEPDTTAPDLSGLVSTKVKYPTLLSKRSVTNSIGKLEDILLSALNLPKGGLPQLLQEGVYTNATLGTVAAFLFPTLGGLSSLVAKGPADLAKSLTEEKFAGARAALEKAAATTDAEGNPVGKLDAWNYVAFQNGDYGFQDGDREGFLDAAATLFRPLSIITMAIQLENSINTGYGTYVYGAYEDLVPLFEALGLRGVMSSHEYTLAVKAAENSDLKMDARIRPILAPVFNLIDDLAADPMNTLLDFLPKLGRVLSTDLLDTQIQTLVKKVKMIDVPAFSLQTGDLFDMIAPMLSNIELKAAEMDEEGNVITPAVTLSLTLDKGRFIQFIDEIAGCGAYVASDSVSRESIYRVDIQSDKTDAYVVLFRYLFTELTSEDNMASVVAAIDAMNMNPFAALMIKSMLTMVGNASANGALRTVTLALPVINAVLKVVQFFSKLFA